MDEEKKDVEEKDTQHTSQIEMLKNEFDRLFGEILKKHESAEESKQQVQSPTAEEIEEEKKRREKEEREREERDSYLTQNELLKKQLEDSNKEIERLKEANNKQTVSIEEEKQEKEESDTYPAQIEMLKKQLENTTKEIEKLKETDNKQPVSVEENKRPIQTAKAKEKVEEKRNVKEEKRKEAEQKRREKEEQKREKEEQKKEEKEKKQTRAEKREEKRKEKLKKEPVYSSFNKAIIVADKKIAVYRGLIAVLCGFCLILSVMVIRLGTRIHVPPYVIEIDPLTGKQNKNTGIVKTLTDYHMSEALIVNTLKTYVTNLRTVSRDPDVNKAQIRELFQFTDSVTTNPTEGNAFQKLQNYFSANNNEKNPVVRCEHEYVTVEITNYLRIKESKENKFQFTWTERTYSVFNDNLISERNYRADINYDFFSATEKQMEFNPLGIFITSCNVSEIKNGYLYTSEK